MNAIPKRMQLGLRTKLFIALFVTAILAVGATSIAARVAFLRGFFGYLNDQEMVRVRGVLPVLAAEYRKNGGWEFVRADPRAWFVIIAQIDSGRALSRDSWPGFPPPFGDPPPFFAPPLNLTALGMRVALLDSERRFIIGNPAIGSDVSLQAVRVDDKVVGWVAILPFNRLTAGAAGAFQRRQLASTWIIGLAAVALAAIVAVLLTPRLLEPIRRIGAATDRLAAGDYATRLEVSTPDEIGRLAADFNRMAVVLEKNEVVRRAFMADVSHELRTPIAILRAELEAIEDQVRILTPESLRSLQGEVATLGKLIDDLYELSLADIGALIYRMSRVDVAALLQQRMDAFRERYAERRIIIEASLPEHAPIDADETRIQQLFNNLMENSLRYTEPGGRLHVACLAECDVAVIDLQDSAPGVPEELLPRLFERFYRVDPSRNRASGGAGLGLSIAKSIVEAHGGTILARGSPFGGLWIRVCLPRLSGR